MSASIIQIISEM